MSSPGKTTTYWKDRMQEIPRPVILVGAITGISILVFFKARPYFIDNPEVKPFVRENERKSEKDKGSKLGLSSLLASSIDSVPKIRASGGGSTSDRSAQPRSAVAKVLERPIFDGKNVTLQVRLMTALDSNSGDSGIEGRILGVIDQEQAGTVDSTWVKNATIRGSANPNFDSKRYMARFSEVLTTEGKTLPIAGVAFNPADASIGIPSDYSSGLPSRLLGGAINRVIVAADQVAQTRVLDDNSQSAVDRELGRVARQGSTETANGLGDEASKGLRETKPILKVPAGTVIYVKMQAGRNSGGSR